MALDLSSNISGYDGLKAHFGHRITIACYGKTKDPRNLAIECEGCNEVLLDFDRPTPKERKAEKARIERPAVEQARRSAADQALAEAKLDVEVIDVDNWESDGDDRLICSLYYENEENPKADSVKGSFIVDFKPGTAEVGGSHANL